MVADRISEKVTQAAARSMENASRKADRAARVADRELEKAARVSAMAEKVADRADRVAQKAVRHIEGLDRLANYLDALDVWTRTEPGARRPRFTRDEIAAAAIKIADSEGFEAVSMRRLAAELEAGTMTLYHYVRTKDELLAVVNDALMGELIVPEDELPTNWRDAVSAIAHRSCDMIRRHPWILDISDDPNLGPNSVRHFDQSLKAVASLDVPLEDMLDVMTVVDEYVFGYCLHYRSNFHHDAHEELSEEMMRYVQELVATGAYPHLTKLTETYGVEASWDTIRNHAYDDARFDRNLSRILDGFEAEFERRRG
jgi:AcrR family transcriptional regulator